MSLQDFSAQTTVHGLPKILSNDSVASKCIWLVLFSGATALFLIQGITLLSDYFKYPTRTVLGTDTLKEFPSVTLCNLRHIDPVLNLLFAKSLTGKLPKVCDSKKNKSQEDRFLCHLKHKYKRQLKTYDFLRIAYKNIQGWKQNPASCKILWDILQKLRNKDFMISAISTALGSRATFAANVLKSRLSKPEDFGFEFDHFFVNCRYGSNECAVPQKVECSGQNDNDTWCFKRNQVGFKRLYETNHFNCYTFNPAEFLVETWVWDQKWTYLRP